MVFVDLLKLINMGLLNKMAASGQIFQNVCLMQINWTF